MMNFAVFGGNGIPIKMQLLIFQPLKIARNLKFLPKTVFDHFEVFWDLFDIKRFFGALTITFRTLGFSMVVIHSDIINESREIVIVREKYFF